MSWESRRKCFKEESINCQMLTDWAGKMQNKILTFGLSNVNLTGEETTSKK
jgi:hypothetical protein